ncbi:hypothetical protein EZL74_01315 [Flavobacterium silvisoli]|uniref:Lipid/polyisoprenoid-binding YceI-like domain-containing protein n=1 Tax=Flavobacterium silvisoli TaxID=2529433 RepID=A0A4V6N0E5_9FLAO|nr:hypothetical protein [Flavobacterium silvisoli]TBX71171.1 hypothetical protein EZL74_01315 [Flavobacterium silvisoli]
MKKISLLKATILFLWVLSFSSCSNDSSSESFGTSTGNYWPMAVNNAWNLDADGVTQQIKLIGTATFGGSTYYELIDEGATDTYGVKTYMTKKGAIYYQKTGDLNTIENGVTISMKSYEMPILKDDLQVNETWSGTLNPKLNYSYGGTSGTLPVTINYNGKITARDAAETINGVTYTNIIKTTLKVESNINGQITVIDSEYWYAKDIGPIRESQTIDGGLPVIRTLLTYTLN